MLARVEQVDDLNSSGEVIFSDVPDPFGAISDDDFLFGAAPAAFPGLDIQAFAEL